MTVVAADFAVFVSDVAVVVVVAAAAAVAVAAFACLLEVAVGDVVVY